MSDANEPTRIAPCEPGYDEIADCLDKFGEKGLPLTGFLHIVEGELHGLRRRKAQGFEMTVPQVADDGEVSEARSLDERIAELEKMRSDFEEAVAWLEARRPGEASKPGSGRLYRKMRYGK